MIRRSRAGLRYSAAIRVAILVYRSCCLPFTLVLFSRPGPPSLFVHPLSLLLQSSFFSTLPSLHVRSTLRARASLPLLFRSVFYPRVSSLTFSTAPYSSNSCPSIENLTAVRYPTMEVLIGRKKEHRRSFRIACDFLKFDIKSVS